MVLGKKKELTGILIYRVMVDVVIDYHNTNLYKLTSGVRHSLNHRAGYRFPTSVSKNMKTYNI